MAIHFSPKDLGLSTKNYGLFLDSLDWIALGKFHDELSNQ